MHRKKCLVAFVIIVFAMFSNFSYAQNNCYEEYVELFNARGASAIADGVHEVVISIRDGNKCDCFLAKVEVKDNQIVKSLGLILEDGNLKSLGVKLNARYADPDKPAVLFMEITNGMSATFLSDDSRLLNIFFYKQLYPKAKAAKKAPEASSL